ncbi:response regulator [Pararhodospirillum photometricum]|uniref:response regulator n=1 Tax=Pararhodospirillum photometricum TaxID=1084 RepID=UPI0006891351|nr:response regulator [Pararhodospirillum photometricum]
MDVNPAWEALFGHSKSEVLGQKSLDLSLYLTPSDRQELVGPVLRGDPVRNLEISFHRRDGGIFTGLCSTDLVHLEGQPLLLAMIADITEIKDAERELDRYRRHLETLVEERTRDLVAAEAQAQLILESSAGGLVGVDIRGLITFINPVACTLLETTAHTALGQSLHALIHGRRADGCGPFPAEDCPLLAALRDGRASEGREDVFWTAQSHRLTVLYATRPLIHGDEIKGAVLSFMDIGERKAMEESLRSTRTDLQVVLDTMPSLVAYWNPDFTNRFANGGFKTWLGLEPTSMTGRTLLDILGEECQRNTQPYIERGLNGETSSYETTLLHQGTGELRFVRKSFLPDWEGDTVRGVLAVIDDVTTLKEAERQADAARIEAERLARIRSEFLANMSHEIRTPMNVILGFANLLDRASLGPEERDLVRKLRQAGHSLLGIINDILDFSRIEAGRLTIDVVSFSLAEVLGRIATIMAAAVGSKPIELILEPPPPDADILEGDPLRLEQVLVNLVSNALKFTAEGSVSVGTRPVESSLGMIRLRFSVRDTGIGIPFAKQAEIFSAFAQADGSTTRHYGGSGLGLSISKRLVELMGGTIGVVSAPHAGSEFWIEVPFGRVAAPPAPLPAPVQHLLIVEDHPQARAALVASAESLGWSADSVARGQEALARANAAVLAGTPFEVILLDAVIPNEDALATCRALRELLGSVALVLLLPAGAQPCVFARAHGPDSSLSKPVTPASLRDAVREALRRQSGGDQGTEASAPDPSARLVGKRLLVVDDSEINLDVARLILQAEGAEVVVANDGQEALEKLRTMGDSVDVVLMDVQMPGQDGYETTRRLRSDLGLVALPVVALSAGALPTERDAALAAGMTGFLAKPFEIDDLVATILTLSCCGKDTLRLVKPPSTALDPGRGLRLWGDLGAYRTALRRFCDEYADAGRCMASHLAQGRAEEAATLAHRLKGTAGSLALERLEREAARVGDALKTPIAPPPLDPLADALDDALTAIAAFTEPGPQKPENVP